MATRAGDAGSSADSGRHLPHLHGDHPLELPETGSDDGDVRRFLVVLGLPTFGLAFAMSILTTYGPVVLLQVAHTPGRVGALVGIEGAFALGVPLVAGIVSDRLSPEGLGKRLPFVFAGGPLVLLGALLLPVAPTYLTAGASLLVFFVGYYLYYPPYRALYADLLPRPLYARSQASQAILRGAGLGVALLAGGVLLSVFDELPFLLAGVVVVGTSLSLLPIIKLQKGRTHDSAEASAHSIKDALLGDRRMLLFAAANSLWELSFAGLRTFIVLYVTQGLHHSTTVASLVIGVVAVAYIAGAPIAGRLTERYGIVDVMTVSAVLYGVGLTCGVIPTTLTPLLFLLPFVALAGAILLTLPQALAFLLAPDGTEGLAAGIVDVSRGLGVVLGPVLVGFAVGHSSGIFTATRGYSAMWPVIGVAVLLSVPVLRLIGPVASREDEPA